MKMTSFILFGGDFFCFFEMGGGGTVHRHFLRPNYFTYARLTAHAARFVCVCVCVTVASDTSILPPPFFFYPTCGLGNVIITHAHSIASFFFFLFIVDVGVWGCRFIIASLFFQLVSTIFIAQPFILNFILFIYFLLFSVEKPSLDFSFIEKKISVSFKPRFFFLLLEWNEGRN